MKFLTIALSLFFILLQLACTSLPQAVSEEQKVRSLVIEALGAEIRGDVAGYLKHWHRNGRQLFVGMPPVEGKQAIAESVAAFVNGFQLSGKISLEDFCQNVTVKSDMAIVSCYGRIQIRELKPQAKPINMIGSVVYILIKEQGRWWFWQEDTMLAPEG